MSAINQVSIDSAANIIGQYLQTNEQIGYVVIDVAVGYSDQALQELKAIEGTIRCRVLF